MNLDILHELTNRYRFVIIAGLIGIIIIFIFISSFFSRQPESNNSLPTPSPTLGNLPTITRSVVPSGATLSPRQLLLKLTYPFKFENMTVEMKHVSKVMLIYYTGEESIAKESYVRLLQKLQLKESEYKAEFFPLDASPLPREYDENLPE